MAARPPQGPAGGRPAGAPPPQMAPPVTPAVKKNTAPGAPPPMPMKNANIRNVDIGGNAYALLKEGSSAIPPRPKDLNKTGREIDIDLNTFAVLKVPSQKVYQYDVHIGNGAERRGLMELLWHCEELKQWRAKNGTHWIWDGAALAWSTVKLTEPAQFTLDTAVIKGRKGHEGKDVKHMRIRFAKELSLTTLNTWLQGKTSLDDTVIESMSFLDHLIRETPSKHLVRNKRSFFPPQVAGKNIDNDENRIEVGAGILAVKGIFMSLRAVLKANLQPGLCINVDVANTCFWDAISLQQVLLALIAPGREFLHVQRLFQETNRGPGQWKKSRMYLILKRLRRVAIVAQYRGEKHNYIINDWIPKEPSEITFKKDDKEISVTNHMRAKWDFTPLRWLPTIETTRGAKIPVDSTFIKPDQRYNHKLSEQQTSEMIKFVVTPPSERMGAIQRGVQTLNWKNDPVLKNYGLDVETRPTRVKARLLNPPEILFRKGKVSARESQSGRWRIDGKQFFEPNKRPITSVGFCIVKRDDGRGPHIRPDVCQKFFDKFKRIYQAHGGVVADNVMRENNLPCVDATPGNGSNLVLWTWNTTGTKWSREPDILFFIVPFKDTGIYQLIKRSCELRYGVASQVLLAQHVGKCNEQYISNVCMKVNAKLGGVTCRATEPNGYLSKFSQMAPYNRSSADNTTMIIGADVSHGAPGTEDGSMAAVTVSQDANLTRYAAYVNTNGDHREMISQENWQYFMGMSLPVWRQNNRGLLPRRVIYFRDGVSEGEYGTVLSEEVRDIKAAFAKENPNSKTMFTVIIATKRHHTRFFPAGNGPTMKNGNVLPGTLVETGATNPFEHDWFLCSHAAIKGTARPMHYYVIMNENKFSGPELQQMIFEHCFQYARATTPVSMHPAVYYAHLAAKRAEAHMDKPFMSGPKQDPKAGPRAVAPPTSLGQQSSVVSSGGSESRGDIKPLLPLKNNRGFPSGMWYI